MAAEYTDENVPLNCAECDAVAEGIPQMVQHILDTHPNYTPEEAAEYARIWADSAYEDIEAHNMWRTEEYRRTGVDPDDLPSDRDPL